MYTQGVVLLESPWKVVEVIVKTHLRAIIHIHNVLHGLLTGGEGGGGVVGDRYPITEHGAGSS